jgi:hypothetical protein
VIGYGEDNSRYKEIGSFPTTVMINPGFEVVGNEVSGFMRAVYQYQIHVAKLFGQKNYDINTKMQMEQFLLVNQRVFLLEFYSMRLIIGMVYYSQCVLKV